MTEEQKYINRRKRVARRTFKKFPLFAVQVMKETYPYYTEDLLLSDLPLKYKKKKKKGKRRTAKFLREVVMEELQREIQQEVNEKVFSGKIHKYYTLKENLNQPIEMKVRYQGVSMSYWFSPTISKGTLLQIKEKANSSKSFKEFDECLDKIRLYTRI